MSANIKTVIYEQPLNERIRTLLRFESYTEMLRSATNEIGDIKYPYQYLTSTLDILNLLDRIDLRAELLKEIDRILLLLKKWMNYPEVDAYRLEVIANNLQKYYQVLKEVKFSKIHHLKNDELLHAMRQKYSVSSNLSVMEFPELAYWLSRPQDFMKERFSSWVSSYNYLIDPISYLLDVIRGVGDFTLKTSTTGTYVHNIDSSGVPQLLRIAIDESINVFPETSGSKHRVSIRFLTAKENSTKPTTFDSELEFKISLCTI
jgi:cell division protein ZapD